MVTQNSNIQAPLRWREDFGSLMMVALDVTVTILGNNLQLNLIEPQFSEVT